VGKVKEGGEEELGKVRDGKVGCSGKGEGCHLLFDGQIG